MSIQWDKIRRLKNERWTLRCTVSDDAGADLDVSGLTGSELQVRAFALLDDTAVFSKTITAGEISVSGNQLSCVIEPGDLDEGEWRLEVWLDDGTNQDPLAYGDVQIDWSGGPA